tara:strand:+ start:3152 stop:4429 length:1278 start_codon:yes stop_codon:yes gene_type:complete
MLNKVLVVGPGLTRSGYGEHTRFVLRSIRSLEEEGKIDLYFIPTSWGQTSWVYEDSEEREWLDRVITKTARYQKEQKEPYDISIQVTIPNEWKRMAHYNVGVTAGIETTKVAPVWLEKANAMDKVVTISEFSKAGFINTAYEGVHKQTGQKVILKCETDVEVVHYPVKKYKNLNLNINLETDFNFLAVAQWGPRKNIVNTIEWFVEEFIDQEVGLVVKTFAKGGSLLDRRAAAERLTQFLSKYKNRKCKVYLLHGDMTDEEIHSLYRHPQIKALVSLTHGEGYGLPLFEAAYSGLPVLAPDWSGHLDFLYKRTKDKKGKIKNKAHFAKVEYKLGQIPKEVVWDGVLIADSMWCYAQQGSYKMRLREMYKDYGRFKKQAKDLQKWILKEFSQEKKCEHMTNALLGEKLQEFDVEAWLDNLDVQVSG